MKFLLFLTVFCYSTLISAHHGTFTYDGNTVITLEGEVVVFNYTNPHGSIILLTEDQREVKIEIDGPSLISPMGINRDSLLTGDRIIAYVSPNTLGRDNEVLGREVIKENGTVVRVSVAFARQRSRENHLTTQSVLATWVWVRTNLFEFVASSAQWSLTSAGQVSFDAYDVTLPFAHTECIAATTPTLMMYPTANELKEVNGNIEIDADWMGAGRIIYMDGREHPQADISYYQGHSIGRWEGNTLLIETTNFTSNAIGNIFSIASGPEKKVAERISLNADARSASYSFTLTDPDFLAAPVIATYQWQYRPDVSVSSIPCDLDAASSYLQDLI